MFQVSVTSVFLLSSPEDYIDRRSKEGWGLFLYGQEEEWFSILFRGLCKKKKRHLGGGDRRIRNLRSLSTVLGPAWATWTLSQKEKKERREEGDRRKRKSKRKRREKGREERDRRGRGREWREEAWKSIGRGGGRSGDAGRRGRRGNTRGRIANRDYVDHSLKCLPIGRLFQKSAEPVATLHLSEFFFSETLFLPVWVKHQLPGAASSSCLNRPRPPFLLISRSVLLSTHADHRSPHITFRTLPRLSWACGPSA